MGLPKLSSQPYWSRLQGAATSRNDARDRGLSFVAAIAGSAQHTVPNDPLPPSTDPTLCVERGTTSTDHHPPGNHVRLENVGNVHVCVSAGQGASTHVGSNVVSLTNAGNTHRSGGAGTASTDEHLGGIGNTSVLVNAGGDATTTIGDSVVSLVNAGNALGNPGDSSAPSATTNAGNAGSGTASTVTTNAGHAGAGNAVGNPGDSSAPSATTNAGNAGTGTSWWWARWADSTAPAGTAPAGTAPAGWNTHCDCVESSSGLRGKSNRTEGTYGCMSLAKSTGCQRPHQHHRAAWNVQLHEKHCAHCLTISNSKLRKLHKSWSSKTCPEPPTFR